MLINWHQVACNFFTGRFIKKHVQSTPAEDTHVLVALGADILVTFQLGSV
jgi:hypothetical protein